MKLLHAYNLLVLLSLTTTMAVSRYAKRGCNDMCGNVIIPYPFGIGVKCSINTWYTVDCISMTPFLSAFNRLEILHVNLENQTVTVNMPKYSDCQNQVPNYSQTMSMDLGTSPFLFSKSHNKFVFEGCGNAVMTDQRSQLLTRCSMNCQNDNGSDMNNCFSIDCGQIPIPHYFKSYNINITGHTGDDVACGSAFLVDESSYVSEDNRSYVPVSLLWTLPQSADPCGDSRNLLEIYLGDGITTNSISALTRDIIEVYLGDGVTINSWKCVFDHPGEGNPYISNIAINVTEECARCQTSGSACLYGRIDDPDGVFVKWNFTCLDESLKILDDKKIKESKVSLGIILGISISMGVLFLVVTSYLLFKVIKKTKEKRQGKRFFKRNGGLLLKQQQEADSSLVGKTILFTARELEKATDNFNENRVLGRGGQGTVYKGMLVDGRIVAVKKSKIVDESQLEQFINEVVILSQVNHRNVVKLLGCCLETDVPLLVSEFIPNGTLYARLHDETDDFPASLNMRLQIATEVAGALAYLHYATSIPIYHRDIKTANILLDDKHRAKVSDFGTSRFVAMDQTHLTTLVKGTFGYLDPEYFQSSQFTEKSDVYSFGVVLVELFTREKPISLTRFGENRSLATHFMLAMEEGRVMSILDPTVIKEDKRNELLEVANLAMRCLNLNGKFRPTMKEVSAKLETIRTSHVPFINQTTIGHVKHAEELFMATYGESSSTYLSFNDDISR